MLSALNGSKTYIAAIASAVAAWIGVWAGTVDMATAWQITQTSVIGAAIRHGIG